MTVFNQDKTIQKGSAESFIPADKSGWFIKIFTIYTKWLFRFRFRHVWIRYNYQPSLQARTIFFCNHSSWWDGLIPVLLASDLSLENSRAMMEDRQLIRYPFFKKLGAFSVSSENSAIRSLRYAVHFLRSEKASLFIFPEGEITTCSTEKPEFKRGVAWLSRQIPEAELVPVGIYIHAMRSSRPELHIQIGEPVPSPVGQRSSGDDSPESRNGPGHHQTNRKTEKDSYNHDESQERILSAKKNASGKIEDAAYKQKLELVLQKQLNDLHTYSGFTDSYFQKRF